MDKGEYILSEITKLFPLAACELRHSNALELMVAIMLSAQTTDQAVNQVTLNLFQKYQTLEDYIHVPLLELESDLRHLGLYKNKSKNIKKMAEMIQNEYLGEFPNDQEALESLPGVGRKTANVFLAEWFHEPRIAVDTHVQRISTRLGLAEKSDSPEKVEQKLMMIFPKTKWIDAHHKMIFFGRYFCKAIKPQCSDCPFIKICTTPFP